MNLLKKFMQKIFLLLRRFWAFSTLKKILVLAVIIFAGWLVSSQINKQNTKPQYQTAQAERGTLVSSVTASGTVSTGTNTSISTQATGIVSQVYVKNGDDVGQGQNIATLTLDQSSQQK